MADVATVSHEGYEVRSNHATEAEMRAGLGIPEPEPVTPAEPDPVPAPALVEAKTTPAEPAKSDEEEDAAIDPASEAGRILQKRKGSFQTRIGELTKAQREAERGKAIEKQRADAAEARLRELEAAKAAPAAPAEPAKPTAPATEPADAEPTLDQFSDQSDPYAAYVRAIGMWSARQEAAKVRKELEERDTAARAASERDTAGRAQQEVFARFGERLEAFRTSHADYDALQDAVKDVPVPIAMQHHVFHSELGAELLYYLAQPAHRADLDRIVTLPPWRIHAELGAIEKAITAQAAAPSGPAPAVVPAAAAPAVTKAKPPIKPVGASPVAVDDDEPPGPDASYAEHKRYYDAQDRKAGIRV